MELPTAEEVTDKRIGRFKQRISETLDTVELDLFRKLVQDYQQEFGVPVLDVAAALGAMAQGKKPLVTKSPAEKKVDSDRKQARKAAEGSRARTRAVSAPDKGMERFRIEV